jgi:hypothetical protein
VLDGVVFAINYYGSRVYRIDADTNTAIELGAFPETTLNSTAGAGSLWISMLESDETLRIDPETMEVTERYAAGADPGWLAFGEGALWITELRDDVVLRIDP